MRLEEIYWHYIVEEDVDGDVTTSGFQNEGDCSVFAEEVSRSTDGIVRVYMINWTNIEEREYVAVDVTKDFV